MAMNGSEYISLQDLAMAYRKAKVDLYYMSHSCATMLLEYEQKLHENLTRLHNNLLSDDSSWVTHPSFLGDWALMPKQIKFSKTDSEANKSFINADPALEWQQKCEAGEKPIAEFRLMGWVSIDFHVLSALWMIKVGRLYDEKLGSCAYGNRLHRTATGKDIDLVMGSFRSYLKPFRDWRDNGIKAMEQGLKDGKKLISITADVQSFYHELNSGFMLDKSFLEQIGLTLDENQAALTLLFIDALNAWAKETPLKKGLPVGLPASAVIANMALWDLDRIINKEIVPLYYGRYVDDILLVVENKDQFENPSEVWNWIIKRSNALLKQDEYSNVTFEPKYHIEHKSKISFANDKNKIFLLSGASGFNLLNSLTRQIQQRASEWRSLPSLPSDPIHIATDLLAAAQKDGEEADNLRKTDALSMRRSGFAIKLRDFEAYERDLLPAQWQQQRKAFLDTFIDHILSLPVFFDFYIYLPRVIRLVVACEDFALLKRLILKLFKLVDLIQKDCNIQIKACPQSIPFNGSLLLEKWENQLIALIEENLQQAFPFRLTRNGANLWKQSFNSNGLKTNNIKVFKPSLPKRYFINPDFRFYQDKGLHFFHHDLAYVPFRNVGLPHELLNHRKLPSTRSYISHELNSDLLDSKIQSALIWVANAISKRHKAALPLGLVFATRPYNLNELFLLHKKAFKPDSLKEIADALMVLRGHKILNPPIFTANNCLEVPYQKDSSKKNVAVTCWKTEMDSWKASMFKKPDPDDRRYQRMTHLFNAILQTYPKPDYVILPELSMPASWFMRFAEKLSNRGIALISGIEYLHAPKSTVHNTVWAALTHDALGYPSMMVYRQDKQRPAIHEEAQLEDIAGLNLKPVHGKQWKSPPVIQHGDFRFAMLICSELTNIDYRAALRGRIDALFVPEWNQDTESFNAMVEASALDIHAFIIQCNDRQYGDSRIRAPYQNSWQRDVVRVKGGKNDYFVVGEINVDELRQFQSHHRSPSVPFKPVPDGYRLDKQHRWKLPI